MDNGVKLRVKGKTFTYYKSTSKGKKLMTRVDGKLIHFGDANMEHYKDRTGIWSSQDHGDKQRRASYLARHRGGEGAKMDDPSTPSFHAANVLW